MVELKYVKKRKRKKLAAIISALATLGISVFVIVAFLGRFVGTFTVALDTGSVKLSLAEKHSFEDSTSYIKFDSLPPFDLTTFVNLPAASVLDNEETPYLAGSKTDSNNHEVLKFFKTTFFVRNSGDATASYELKVNITKDDPGIVKIDGYFREVRLSSILRVMVYENDNDDNHNYTVYAQKRTLTDYPTVGEDDNVELREYTSFDKEETLRRYGNDLPYYAEMFESDYCIATRPVANFVPGDVKRYTIVVWLEGEDHDASGTPPTGGNLKLGVTINAYEN